MDKLVFGTAGMPISTEPRKYKNSIEELKKLNLNAMEVEFVRGVRMNPATQLELKELAPKNDIILTSHGPYYINLNSQEPEKIDASITRILETARMAHSFGGYSITFHAAYYMKLSKELVFNQVEKTMAQIMKTLEEENIDIWIRPETTGKGTQWGDLDEIVQLSKKFDKVLPCVDFSHLHARSVGEYNTYDEFCKILDTIGTELGDYALKNFHAHIAGIEYGAKGEKKHLMLEESDMNYKDLMKAIKTFDVKGVIICESPIMEKDAILLQDYYNSI